MSSAAIPGQGASAETQRRGAFIVLEGLDRSGKSTQVQRLVDALVAAGTPAVAVRFPDRTTAVGQAIDAYLARRADLDDRAIHLLFAANRWERAGALLADLAAGVTVVADRYAFSGAAFSAAKGLDLAWCKAPDAGLPAPDLVLFLDVDVATAASRGGYGGERYEEPELQRRVRAAFGRLADDVGPPVWRRVDAAGTLDEVTAVLSELVRAKVTEIRAAATTPPIAELRR